MLICFLVALYASFVYRNPYASLVSFPIEFEDERGCIQTVGALPFPTVGRCSALMVQRLMQQTGLN